MQLEGRTGREWLEGAVRKVVEAIQEDDLLRVMLKEDSSGGFASQRVNEIVDYVYKADREQLVDRLV
jgi:hypothetical protein